MRFLFLLIGILFPLSVFAQALGQVGGGYASPIWAQACTVLPYCNMGGQGVLIVTGIIVEAVLWTIGAGSAVVILYAAVRMAASGASEEVLSKSKKVIFYAALGLLLAIMGSTIVNYVFSLVGNIASSV